MMAEHWGYPLYLIVLNAICPSVTSKDNVLNFIKELVVEIDMVSLVSLSLSFCYTRS